MHPIIKSRPAGGKAPASPGKPLGWHDVTRQAASAYAASRRRMIATQPASGTAHHARHQVARQTQS